MEKPRVLHPVLVAARVAFVWLAAAPLAFARPAPGEDTIDENALRQIQALEQQKLERTPAQIKMDSQLIYALHRSVLRKVAPDVEPNLQIQDDGRVLVDITAVFSDSSSGPPSSSSARRPQPRPGERVGLLGRIEELGGTVINAFPQYRAIRALLPMPSLEALAGNPDVIFIERAAEATTNTGSVTGEGDATHRAAAARTVSQGHEYFTSF